jgi:hypothetical protein
MQDKKAPVVLLRTLSIGLILFAIGVMVAQMLGHLDIPLVMPLGLLTVGLSLSAVASSAAKRNDRPD